MYRRLGAVAVLVLCILAAANLNDAHAKRPREGRVLADLFCRTEYDDAIRATAQLRGEERHAARDAARDRYQECHRKARKAYQVEDVMPRLFAR